jgi:NAD-dependent SIR2 family protein deacetylase
VCRRGCGSSDGLNSHLVTAHGRSDLRVACPACGVKSYSCDGAMMLHFRNAHPGLTVKRCQQCRRKVLTADWDSHLALVHGILPAGAEPVIAPGILNSFQS